MDTHHMDDEQLANLRARLEARLPAVRAFYWPQSERLRRVLYGVAGVWLILALADMTQPGNAGGVDLLFTGPLGITLTWAIVRAVVYDRGDRLATRLPLRSYTQMGQRIFYAQLVITVLVLFAAVTAWIAHPLLAIAWTEFVTCTFVLALVWIGPPVARLAIDRMQHPEGSAVPPWEQWREYTPHADDEEIPWPDDWPSPDEPPTTYEQACRYLGVHPSATLEQVKIVRDALAKKYHPDTGPPEERDQRTERMATINAAYAIIAQHKS